MKISYNWLKEYIRGGSLPGSHELHPQVISNCLTNAGLEVESLEKIESVKGGLKGLVIGQVLEKQKHPNADKLVVTKVNAGTGEPLQIVCGAPNVEAEQKVVVALPGATLFQAAGEPFEIKKSKIRGEVSEGMICAEDEIGLGTSHDGILVLDQGAAVGTPAADYFKVEEDFVFEIGLTPNRADAASHIGVARDLIAVINSQSAMRHLHLQIPAVENFKVNSHDLEIEVVVEDKENCIRYSGISLTNVEVKESPGWLKNRLKAIGLKPVNNVVDISNFVLFETGQPLHIFDADKISGKKVVVKKLPAKTKFKTLDEKERELTGEELMICDASGGMCIAGVFGGMNSGVTSSTKNIFIESACFRPASIRKTSKHHGLKTDASFRFERGTDPDITVYALKRAALLTGEICGGKYSSEIIDIYPVPVQPAKINYNFNRASALMGMEIDKTVIKNILAQTGIGVASETSEALELTIPNFKSDVKREADVIEEVMRIYGYGRVPLPQKMNMPLPVHEDDAKEKLVHAASQFLVAGGFFEMFNNSLTRESYSAILEKQDAAVKILNPLSNDLNLLRQTMIFSGLETIQHNSNRQHPDLRFFEFGKIYFKTDAGFDEEEHLAVFVTGSRHQQSWIKLQPAEYTMYFMKSLMNNLLMNSGVNCDSVAHRDMENILFDEMAGIENGTSRLACYGVLKSSLTRQFDIHEPVFYGVISVSEWMKAISAVKRNISEAPKFPEVRRDISMLISKSIKYSDIEILAFETERKLLQDVNLFDVYSDEKTEQGKISYALSFTLRDDEKTLTDKQIDGVMNRLMKAFEEKLEAVIRK